MSDSDDPSGEKEAAAAKYAAFRQREKDRERRSAEARRQAQPIFDDMKKLGRSFESFDDLSARLKEIDETALNILLDHLDAYEPGNGIRHSIARAVAAWRTPHERASALLLDAFETAVSHRERVTFAGAVVRVAHPKSLNRILDLVADDSHCDERVLLASCLPFIMNTEAAMFVLRPFLEEEIPWFNMIIDELGNARVIPARRMIEPFLEHEDSYTRERARRAIGKIDTAIKRKKRRQAKQRAKTKHSRS